MKSNTFSQTQRKQINHGQTLPRHHNPRNFSVILKEKRLQNFHIRLKNLMNIPCHSLKFKTGSKLKIIWYFSGLKANNIHNKVRNRHVDVWVIVNVGVDVCVLHTKRAFVNIISWWGFRCMVYKVIRISVGLSVLGVTVCCSSSGDTEKSTPYAKAHILLLSHLPWPLNKLYWQTDKHTFTSASVG